LTLLDRVYGVGSKKNKSSDALEDMILLGKFTKELGTMSSARNKKLDNFGEFMFELVAQYIITGKIRFNSLPRTFAMPKPRTFAMPKPRTFAMRDMEDDYQTTKHAKVIINDKKYKEFNQRLQNYAKILEKQLDKIFSSLRNKIFVQ